MLASVITVVAALAASATALPKQVYASWPATNFDEGCSPGGCIASFNISAPADYVKGAPAFNVSCHPIYIQQGWVECDVVGENQNGAFVRSMWSEATVREQIKISVSHVWNQGETRFNASGSIEIPSTSTSFGVPVTSLTAVA
ncbi:uncharacterized protein F4822DRAFT_373041 [Hypoxylon trugodes]|uniref:uncharacterized protein n=1 Tax=Hypoxylon trugodes TaxID=326681 RepID=UPI00219E6D57|nr:uncharacterized protein F4822DRAFT_373041 [Hypoxylon trugodes]KAI1384773.1 hypothetical protein F4822DRAFT_373041 [Hypoxylon trugodes]